MLRRRYGERDPLVHHTHGASSLPPPPSPHQWHPSIIRASTPRGQSWPPCHTSHTRAAPAGELRGAAKRDPHIWMIPAGSSTGGRSWRQLAAVEIRIRPRQVNGWPGWLRRRSHWPSRPRVDACCPLDQSLGRVIKVTPLPPPIIIIIITILFLKRGVLLIQALASEAEPASSPSVRCCCRRGAGQGPGPRGKVGG